MLISTAELDERLRKEAQQTVVLDCRFRLDSPSSGLEQYMRGHIPGAWYLDLEKDLSGPVQPHGGRHPLPDAQELADKLGLAGVGNGALAVVYDGGEGMAPRAWWLIRYLGFDDVRLLDGGLPAWLASGYPTSDDIPTPNPKAFPLQPRTDWVVDVQDIEQVRRGERQGILIDARAAERYRGETEPLDPKAGHIPGAINAPWMDSFGQNGEWKSAAEQRQRFASVPTDCAVMAYCGSGVTACVNVFAMELAGIQNVKLYAGSWSDWCSYENLPVATGNE